MFLFFPLDSDSDSSESEQELQLQGAVGGTRPIRRSPNRVAGLDLDQLRLDQAAAASQQLTRDDDGAEGSSSDSADEVNFEETEEPYGSYHTVASQLSDSSQDSSGEMSSALQPPSQR